ncbi:MAG TPA: NYN domain-containing protein [Mycobacteriales bacterium]|nr:NYN domain-containing protein [Mycobacteriales bacterium]
MAEREQSDQVAVYIDFDNVVISRYDEVHGERSFHEDIRNGRADAATIDERLKAAHLDIGAVLEYAASFGTVAISRAYADWSAVANVAYKTDLVRASIDLVQMFPLSGTKNGADIRLAIDVIDDLSRYDYVNHVVIVAGDSDYVSLAQRCKRLGRTVIGVGVARSVGKYWRTACDVFRMYDALPGIAPSQPSPPAKKAAPAKKATQRKLQPAAESPSVATLRKAMSLQSERNADGWVGASTLKNQMLRLDPTFNEKSEGHKSFAAFLAAHPETVETRSVNKVVSVRLVGG